MGWVTFGTRGLHQKSGPFFFLHFFKSILTHKSLAAFFSSVKFNFFLMRIQKRSRASHMTVWYIFTFLCFKSFLNPLERNHLSVSRKNYTFDKIKVSKTFENCRGNDLKIIVLLHYKWKKNSKK